MDMMIQHTVGNIEGNGIVGVVVDVVVVVVFDIVVVCAVCVVELILGDSGGEIVLCSVTKTNLNYSIFVVFLYTFQALLFLNLIDTYQGNCLSFPYHEFQKMYSDITTLYI